MANPRLFKLGFTPDYGTAQTPCNQHNLFKMLLYPFVLAVSIILSLVAAIEPTMPIAIPHSVKTMVRIYNRYHDDLLQYESEKVTPMLVSHVYGVLAQITPLVNAGMHKRDNGFEFSADEEQRLTVLGQLLNTFSEILEVSQDFSELAFGTDASAAAELENTMAASESDWENCDPTAFEDSVNRSFLALLKKEKLKSIQAIQKANEVTACLKELNTPPNTSAIENLGKFLFQQYERFAIFLYQAKNADGTPTKAGNQKLISSIMLIKKLTSVLNFFKTYSTKMEQDYAFLRRLNQHNHIE